jgi:hypothetical protein
MWILLISVCVAPPCHLCWENVDAHIDAGAEARNGHEYRSQFSFSCLLCPFHTCHFPSLIHFLACEPHGPMQTESKRPSKTASPPFLKSSMHRRRHVQHVPSHTRPTHSYCPVEFTRPPSTPHNCPSPAPPQSPLRLSSSTCMLSYIQKHPVLAYPTPEACAHCGRLVEQGASQYWSRLHRTTVWPLDLKTSRYQLKL